MLSGEPVPTEIDSVPIDPAPNESDSATVKLVVPTRVGTPTIDPDGSRLRPGGSEPVANFQVKGPMPPDASSVPEYQLPSVPAGRAVELTVSGPLGLSVRARTAVVVVGIGVAESVTVTGTFTTPVPVGKPVSSPAESSDRPAGCGPEANDQV
jgi:hypothetical protein